jgi:hypothetical protein
MCVKRRLLSLLQTGCSCVHSWPVSLRRTSVTSLRGKGPARFVAAPCHRVRTPTHIMNINTEQATIRASVITTPSIAIFCLLHSMQTRFLDKQSADHRIPPIRIETVGSLLASTASHHVSVLSIGDAFSDWRSCRAHQVPICLCLLGTRSESKFCSAICPLS